MKKILVILLTGSLILANSAYAGRFGGGRNSGMQRSATPSSSYSNSNSGYSAPSGTSTTSNSGQQRSGMGAGTAALLGAAAGAAGGYMMAKSGNNNQMNASGTSVSTETRSSIPWGTIAILIAILALGLIFFRKKTSPRFSPGKPMNSFTPNGFNLSSMNRTNAQANPINSKASIVVQPAPELDKMPDGIETIYFLRQVKGMFLHIQSMNNSENLNEIKKYMTATLFEETKNDVANNTVIADFTALDCQLVQCDALPAEKTDDGATLEARLIATVKFFGMISEDPSEPPQPFGEIWNFIKSNSTNNKWLVAGIQQDVVKTK